MATDTEATDDMGSWERHMRQAYPHRFSTWRKLIASHLAQHGLGWDDVIACTLSEDLLDKDFYNGVRTVNGAQFTAWTANRVLFPALSDGAEIVASAPRNPCDEATPHVGGE